MRLMFSSLLSKFLAGLLVSVLCSAIITIIMSQTLLSAHYIEGRLTAVNGYNRLSTALTQEVSQEAGATNNPEVNAKLQSILTPTALEQKINTALDQLQQFYQGKAPAPTITLNDLATQAQAQGIPVQQTTTLTQPIELAGNGAKTSQTNQTNVAKTFDHIRLTTILTAGALTAALLALSWRRHRYSTLPDVLVGVGVLMGLIALTFYLSTGLANHYIKFSTTSNAFAELGRDLAENIVRDLGWRFAIIAVVCFVAGLTTRIFAARLQAKGAAPKSLLGRKPRGAVS